MPYIDIHTHQNVKNKFAIRNFYPKDWHAAIPYYYSIGIHPWYIDAASLTDDLAIIDKALATKNCLALGECGLDKLSKTDFNLQKVVFEKQLLLAEKHIHL